MKLPRKSHRCPGGIPVILVVRVVDSSPTHHACCRDRYGDFLDGKSVSLCVRRATYWDPDLGAEDPSKKGVCSNYLCDATPGTDVKMTGPSGKVRAPNCGLVWLSFRWK